MAETYLPTRESDLVNFSTNFNARLVAGGPGGAYGLSAPTIAAYTALHDAWIAAYTAAVQDITRTPVTIQAKDDAKEALINGANGIRQLVNIIQHNPATTNEERAELQITVPDVEPSPVPVPAFAPGVDIVSSSGRTARIRLHDTENPTRRGKPDGVVGATVFSFIGDEAPADIDSWEFEGNTRNNIVEVEFPAETPNGATVWFTAFWRNTRDEAGPPSAPVSTNIPGGLSMAA